MQLLRWQIVVALDILTEALIFAMSYHLVHGLHMALKNKFIVLGAFGFRLMSVDPTSFSWLICNRVYHHY